MPLLTVHLPAGYTPNQKSELLQQSSQAVTDAIGAPQSSIRITLQEHSAENTIVAGQIGAPHLLYIVYLIEGRTVELKSALIAALDKVATTSLGLTSDEVRVMIQDVPKSDMGMAGGISALAAGR